MTSSTTELSGGAPPANPLRLVFLGSDPIAQPLLDWLAGEGSSIAQVVAVWTQPDRPVGRGQKIAANEIKTWALSRSLPVYQPAKITDEWRLKFAAERADVALVMAYGHILRDDFIATPRLGTLNLHTSLLPKFRGASPIQTAIASGERETGVTLMQIVRRLDAGPVAEVERVAIGLLETARDIERKLALACVPLLARTLPRLRDGQLSFTPQDDRAATYCRRLAKEDGVVDLTAPAAAIAARINGLFPWPACSVVINGQAVKLGLADGVAGTAVPGEVVGADADGLLVGTGGGLLRLRQMQRPGGRMLAAAEFLRGFPVAPGTKLESHAMPPLLSAAPFRR